MNNNILKKTFSPGVATLGILVGLGMFSSPVQAGTIIGISSISGLGLCPGTSPPSSVETVTSNNDEAGLANNNRIRIGEISERKQFCDNKPIDIVFNVVNSGGVTEYRFADDVINMTGVDWSDFHLELGFGIGDNFQSSPADDGLDFDFPDNDPPATGHIGSTVFQVMYMEDGIWFFGNMPNGSEPSFASAIDVPDGLPDNQFTVRQYPSTPEPSSTLGLIALGTLGTASTLKGKLKPSKSTKKETTKVF